MKSRALAAAAIAFLILPAGRASHAQAPDCPCQPAAAADTATGDPGVASIAYFHTQLTPYGRWVVRPGYGEVWVPGWVAPGWRPYTTGHWVYTDQGWAWVADESWGWAPFHYGRWFYDAPVGWAWVPGTVWAPAWVAWRYGGGYVGWAALPPAVGFAVGVGVRFGGVDLGIAIAPTYYSFVPERSILAPRLAGTFAPPSRCAALVGTTTNVTNYSVVGNRVVNTGVPVASIERATGQPVPRMAIGQQPGFVQPAVMGRAAARSTAGEEFTHRYAGTAMGAGGRPGVYQPAGLHTAGPATAATTLRSTGAAHTLRSASAGTTGTTGTGAVHTNHTRSTLRSTRTTGAPGSSAVHRTTGTTGSFTTGTTSRHTTTTTTTTHTRPTTGAPAGTHTRPTTGAPAGTHHGGPPPKGATREHKTGV